MFLLEKVDKKSKGWYTNIRKESLQLVFFLKHCDQYVYKMEHFSGE